ncbi:MAG: hypothetical protein U0T73_06765 [Chitinophagales bacterium]
MKRTLGLLLVVAVLFAGYLWVMKPKPPVCKGLEKVSFDSISPTGRELKGELLFANESKLRTQLGEIEFKAKINGTEVGAIHQEVSSGISKQETYRLPFQLRFSTDEIVLQPPYRIEVTGEARSTTLFANYRAPIQINLEIQ